MDLIMLILGIALVGLLVWAIVTYIPMPPIFKRAITIIAIVVVVLYLIRVFSGSVPDMMP